MRIAVDAMGGDFAPREIVAGSVDAARSFPNIARLFLVGDEKAVRAELARHRDVPASVEVRHAAEVVGMGEKPAVAIRRKKDSSISRAVDLVKHGEADAVFAAGSTGAAVAAAQLKLRALDGVQRPAIATVFPSPVKPFVLLDAGANSDCSARMLVEFAVMGVVYSREVLGCATPRVGLMSIGEEDAKGNEITKETFGLLQASGLNFEGNIEGHDLFEGKVDVVVCDGFVGNVILKTSESVAHAMGTWLKQAFTANALRMAGAMMLRGALKELKQKIDPAAHGGAPLLGVNGVVIIGHGASDARAARNGIRAAVEAVGHRMNEHIQEEIRKLAVGA
jgi:phosphate acyltransferase